MPSADDFKMKKVYLYGVDLFSIGGERKFYVNLVFIIFTILFVFSVKNKPEIIKISI